MISFDFIFQAGLEPSRGYCDHWRFGLIRVALGHVQCQVVPRLQPDPGLGSDPEIGFGKSRQDPGWQLRGLAVRDLACSIWHLRCLERSGWKLIFVLFSHFSFCFKRYKLEEIFSDFQYWTNNLGNCNIFYWSD